MHSLRRATTLLPLAIFSAVAADRPSRPSFYEPTFAPDRQEIAFVSGADIWTVSASGGEAHLLVSDPATDRRPLYSPDGKRLAFSSNRTGNGDIYILDLASGNLRRLTYDDAPEAPDAWSPDGKYIYFSTSAHDVGAPDIYRISAEGGTAMPVSADRYAYEYFAAPAPKGDLLAFAAKGDSIGLWWRNGHSNLEQSEIWLRRGGAKPVYERISAPGARETSPMWSPDASRLYYVSDRSGTENLWMKPLNGAPARLTNFTNGRVLWPGISADGRKIVFEREFAIWICDIAARSANPIPIQLRGTPAGPSTTRLAMTDQFEDLHLSPDGKKVAFVAHGDVFAASSKDGGVAERLTRTAAAESHPRWSPDSRRLVYSSDRAGTYHLFLYNFANQSESQLTDGAGGDAAPLWSPDGKWISFVRDGKTVHVVNPETKEVRQLAEGRFVKPPFASASLFAWSPDSKWLAYTVSAGKSFCNVSAVALASGDPKPVTFLANPGCDSVSWSPDGAQLLFITGFRTETNNIARVDLVPRTPKFREDQFRDLFRSSSSENKKPSDAKPEEVKKPVSITFDGIRRRLSFIPVGLDAHSLSVSPDGKTLLVTATVGNQQNLYTYSLDELARERPVVRQLTSTADRKSDAQFSPDSKEVFFLANGRIQVATVENRQAKPLSVTAEMNVSFDEEKREVFAQAWRYIKDTFYDPTFGGLDWAAERARYEPFIEGSRTPAEMRRAVSLMIGDLNTSHTGINPPFTGPQEATGRLGLFFDPAEYDAKGTLRVTEVVPLSPADVAGVKPGSYLLAVDGQTIARETNLDQLLENKVDRRIVLAVADRPDGGGKRDVPVRPVGGFTERNLLYRSWVESRRAYVAEASRGRLGYVHLRAMGSGDLDQLNIDLDAENHGREGVVIDVRNNNGGFIDGQVLDVFLRRNYQTLVYDGTHSAPQRIIYGQRALERPTILVTNTRSLSDAECFTEGYRVMKLGKVVGEPTSGWVISTGGARLIDGSIIRLPSGRTYTNDGTDMERHPRPVDVLAVRPIGESYTGKDKQLDVAVAELLKHIDARRN